MRKLAIGLLLLSVIVSIAPAAAQERPTRLATFSDETGLFSLQYPADMFVAGAYYSELGGLPPIPSVVLASSAEIFTRPTTPPTTPVKAGQWGIAVFFFPKMMFAPMGVTPDATITQFGEVWTKAMTSGDGTITSLPLVTLANGKEAYLAAASDKKVEDNYLMMHEITDGVVVLTALLSSVDGRTDEMIAAHLALTNSIKFTGTAEDVLKLLPPPAK